ncbi:MAG: hypothetical protein WC511_01930 [Candidatus Pacearchaeota archaeon]
MDTKSLPGVSPNILNIPMPKVKPPKESNESKAYPIILCEQIQDALKREDYAYAHVISNALQVFISTRDRRGVIAKEIQDTIESTLGYNCFTADVMKDLVHNLTESFFKLHP